MKWKLLYYIVRILKLQSVNECKCIVNYCIIFVKSLTKHTWINIWIFFLLSLFIIAINKWIFISQCDLNNLLQLVNGKYKFVFSLNSSVEIKR